MEIELNQLGDGLVDERLDHLELEVQKERDHHTHLKRRTHPAQIGAILKGQLDWGHVVLSAYRLIPTTVRGQQGFQPDAPRHFESLCTHDRSCDRSYSAVVCGTAEALPPKRRLMGSDAYARWDGMGCAMGCEMEHAIQVGCGMERGMRCGMIHGMRYEWGCELGVKVVDGRDGMGIENGQGAG